MKIVFTGGHHTSSLVVAEALAERGHEIIWFGHRRTMWQEPSLSLEYEEVTETGFPFVEIKAGKFYREFNLLKILRIPYGFVNAFWALLRVRPDLIVSFGGYLALPVVVAGWFLRIPSVTHEQTYSFGLANKLIRPFVRRIFLTWEESKKYFPEEKCVVVGLPLRKDILAIKRKTEKKGRPVIYITGGKQGSHLINKTVAEILPELLSRYTVYHQSGKIVKTGDLALLQKKKKSLSKDLGGYFHLKPFFKSQEVAKIFSFCDLVISRSGAHIVSELAFLGIPAIFIPIPWSFENEQEKNAQLFEKNKAGVVLRENDLAAEKLLAAIEQILGSPSFYKNARKLRKKIKPAATLSMVKEIEALLHAQKKT